MRWLVLALLAVVEGCSADTPCTPACATGSCGDDGCGGTCTVASPVEAWAVGDGPTALHWNGLTWASIFPTTIPYSTAYDRVWASAADDVWAVGPGLWHWDGERWSLASWEGISFAPRDVWGDASDNLYAVGNSTVTGLHGEMRPTGTILHWDGATWSIAYRVSFEDLIQGFPESYIGISGSSASDIWATGTWRFTFYVQHWDGDAWSKPVYAPSTIYWPSRPWGTSGTDVWFTDGVRLFHWDGTSWFDFPAGPECSNVLTSECSVSALWGSAAQDVWAVGAAGRIMHWDGRTWSRIQSGTTCDLAAVRGRSATDVWAVGDCGTILHWDGCTWSQVPSGTTLSLHDIWVGIAN